MFSSEVKFKSLDLTTVAYSSVGTAITSSLFKVVVPFGT